MATRTGIATIFLAVSSLAGTCASASPINIFGTGVSVTNGIDNNYAITSGPTAAPVVNGASSAPAYLTTSLGGSWVADNAASSWISPDANANQNFGQYYTYQTTFSLTGLDPTTAQLSGYLSPDDFVTVYLNGTQVLDAFGWSSTTSFTFNNSFVAGLNTLDFVVNNSGGGPTGLNVAISGTASSAATPEPASVGMIGAGLVGFATILKKSRRARKA